MDIEDASFRSAHRWWMFAIWTVSGLIPSLILSWAIPFSQHRYQDNAFWEGAAGNLMVIAVLGGPIYLLVWSILFLRRKDFDRFIMRILEAGFLTGLMCVLNVFMSFAGCAACGKITGHEFRLN